MTDDTVTLTEQYEIVTAARVRITVQLADDILDSPEDPLNYHQYARFLQESLKQELAQAGFDFRIVGVQYDANPYSETRVRIEAPNSDMNQVNALFRWVFKGTWDEYTTCESPLAWQQLFMRRIHGADKVSHLNRATHGVTANDPLKFFFDFNPDYLWPACLNLCDDPEQPDQFLANFGPQYADFLVNRIQASLKFSRIATVIDIQYKPSRDAVLRNHIAGPPIGMKYSLDVINHHLTDSLEELKACATWKHWQHLYADANQRWANIYIRNLPT